MVIPNLDQTQVMAWRDSFRRNLSRLIIITVTIITLFGGLAALLLFQQSSEDIPQKSLSAKLLAKN